MNAHQNVYSASKGLQYAGDDKCKFMNVNKYKKPHPATLLKVDSWKSKYDVNDNLIECYGGKIDMKQVSSIKYLGFVCSEDGTNISNIQTLANKSIGIKKNISFDQTPRPIYI